MKCPQCNHDVEPLTLVNGKWGCPDCKRLFVNYSLDTSHESQELGELSRIYYLKYLEKAPSDNKKDIQIKNKYLEKSKEYAREAAKKSNPLGYYMLAYFYDYDYDGMNLSEAERCKLATPYYNAIALADFSGIKDEKIKADTYEIQKLAIEKFKTMLLEMSHDNRILYGLEEYNNMARSLGLSVDLDDKSDNLDDIDLISKIIDNDKEKTKTPIFSLFTITFGQLKEILKKNIIYDKYLLSFYEVNSQLKINESTVIRSKDAAKNILTNGKDYLNKQSKEPLDNRKVVLTILYKGFKSKYKEVNNYISRFEQKGNKKKQLDTEISIVYNNLSGSGKAYNTNFMFYEDDIIFTKDASIKTLFKLLNE